MASNINPGRPPALPSRTSQRPRIANVRLNFVAAKEEIEALQNEVEGLKQGGVTADITELQAEVDVLKAEVEELKTVVDTQSLAGTWRYLTNTDMETPPGNGNIKSDGASQGEISQFSVSRYTKGWIDGANVFKALAAGDKVYFQEASSAENSGTLEITNKTEYTDYTVFDVTLVKQTGSAIPKNADVVVRFTFHQGLRNS